MKIAALAAIVSWLYLAISMCALEDEIREEASTCAMVAAGAWPDPGYCNNATVAASTK